MTAYFDLHMHSCLSPCGDDDMTPGNIAGMAYLNGLNVVALSDHNTCKNVPALVEAARQYENLLIVPAMELTTAEEIHVLCLFRSLEGALAFDAYVEQHLMQVENDVEIFGHQVIMDGEDNPTGEFPYLLINATDISMEEVFPLVSSFGGLAVPAHIDKQANSYLSQYGFIPPDAPFPCYEMADLSHREELTAANPVLAGKFFLSDSDAHYLHHIREQLYSLNLPSLTLESFFAALPVSE